MFRPCQAEDEDEDEIVQGFHDDCFHLAEFHSSSLFLRVFCFFGFLNLVFLWRSIFRRTFQDKFRRGTPRVVTNMGKCQDSSVGRIRQSLDGTLQLVQIDDYHNLEAQSWDCRRPPCKGSSFCWSP